MLRTPCSLAVVTRRRRISLTNGRYADRTAVRLRGEHDLSTAADLSEVIAYAISIDESDLMVDLAEVQFMDSSTVRVLIRTQAFLESRSRSMVITNPSTIARTVLRACGLTHLMHVAADTGPADDGFAEALRSWVEVPADKPPTPGDPLRISPIPGVRASAQQL